MGSKNKFVVPAVFAIALIIIMWLFVKNYNNSDSSQDNTNLGSSSEQVIQEGVRQTVPTSSSQSSIKPTDIPTATSSPSPGEQIDSAPSHSPSDEEIEWSNKVKNIKYPWEIRTWMFLDAYGNQTVSKEEWLKSMEPYATPQIMEKLGWANIDGKTKLTYDTVSLDKQINANRVLIRVTFNETDDVYILGAQVYNGQWCIDSVAKEL